VTTSPLVLIAELTHRCPLRCAYCSNPVQLTERHAELGDAVWADALNQAWELGIVMVHFTGGEPLLRPGLEALVARATDLGLYSTLITSALGPTAHADSLRRIAALAAAGLRAVQVSFQGTAPGAGAAIAGRDAFEQKLAFARRSQEVGLSLTTNFVLHRGNLEQAQRFVELSLELGADRAELAHVQYHGWAHLNRRELLPREERVEHLNQWASKAKQVYSGQLELVYVMADHFSGRARACMGGWGRKAMVIAPAGRVLPCHAADTLPFCHDRIFERALADIWWHGEAFEAFRGEEWMEASCASCPERSRDFGGCRCQAWALTARLKAMDPACRHSPQHQHLVKLRTQHSGAGSITPRGVLPLEAKITRPDRARPL
jgi:PqqA peptide cyclase